MMKGVFKLYLEIWQLLEGLSHLLAADGVLTVGGTESLVVHLGEVRE